MVIGATHKVTASFAEQLALSLRQPMRAARTVKAGVNSGAAALRFPGLRRSIQLFLHAKTLPSKTVFETMLAGPCRSFILPSHECQWVEQGPSSGSRKPTPTAICLAPTNLFWALSQKRFIRCRAAFRLHPGIRTLSPATYRCSEAVRSQPIGSCREAVPAAIFRLQVRAGRTSARRNRNRSRCASARCRPD